MKNQNPLREILRDRKISQNTLALELSISAAHLSRILNGKRRLGVGNALRIAKHLNVPMESLFQ